MTEEAQSIDIEDIPQEYKKTLEWVNSLKKPDLIKELEARNLVTTGSVSDLKVRLFWFFLPKYQSDINNKSNIDQNNHSSKVINNFNMNRNPFFKPTTFSGGINERVDSFLKTFNRAALINNWSETDKPQYLVAFLQGPALTFYDNIESKNLCWKELEIKFREEFEPIAQNDMLRILLERRKQVDDEPTGVFINEIEALCNRIDKNMSEDELVRNVMRGLKPSIARYIGILENRSLVELKKNIRKYEMVEFMITGETAKSSSEIKQSLINEKINKITRFNNDDGIKKLNDEISMLKQKFQHLDENINFVSNNNQFQNNNNFSPRNNRFLSNNRSNYYAPRNYNEQFQNNRPGHNFSLNNQNYSQRIGNFRTNKSQNNYKNNQNNFKNNNTLECSICSKNNHTSENCFLGSNIKCQICDGIGHTALKCFKISKNLN